MSGETMMLRNNNQQMIKVLSKEYMKANKLRNVIAILAIILTTIMFAAVVTIYQGSEISIHEQMLYQSGNRFMIAIQNIEKEKSKDIKKNVLFSEIYEVVYLGKVSSENTSPSISLKYADEGYLHGAYVEYIAGNYPERENEICVPKGFLTQDNKSVSVGSDIKLNYSVNGKTRQKNMVVSGIYQGHPNESELNLYVSKDFCEREMAGLQSVKGDEIQAGSISLYGNFKDTENLKDKQEQVLNDAGVNIDSLHREEGTVNSAINIAYQMNTQPTKQEIRIFFLLILLILFSGFLIIFNVFKISVMKDVRIYGQLKTIGASPKQLRKLVEYQALRMALIGIPIGTLLGWGLGNMVLPLMMSITTYQDSLFVLPDLRFILATVLFSFLTVWISCKIPALIVSRLSPIQSLKYQGRERISSKKVRRGKESKARILNMALTNLAENKGRTILVTISIALSIVLFNSVLNFTSTFQKDTYVQGQAGAEFNVYNPTFTAGARLFFDDTDSLPVKFIDHITHMEGMKDGGFVYFHGKPMDIPDNSELRSNYNGIVTAKILDINDQPYTNDAIQEVGQALYGFDDSVLERVTIVEGNIDYEKLKSGQYVIGAIISDENGMDYAESMLSVHVGDKISAEIEGKSLEYEVLACVAVNSKLISPAQPGEATFLILPSGEFLDLFPDKKPVRFLCDSKSGMYHQVESYLDAQISQGQHIIYESSQSINTEFEIFTGVYKITGNIFAILFGILGVLNLLNVIITS
ncbi:MAG: ABC transporter permease, partial [Lachnospiraceae bacterium]|nr:ABC transporter permease [Lachnospiraceae bacterium]